MNYVNTIKINTNNLLSNIDTIKENYAYSYIILDVSNNAFNHGMYIIHYLKDKIDYLYVHDLSDLLLIRKYDKDIPVIYGGKVHQDNVYDLIINDAILVISNMEILKNIKSLNIKDKVTFILGIDPKGYFGIAKKEDILDFLEWDHKYFELALLYPHQISHHCNEHVNQKAPFSTFTSFSLFRNKYCTCHSYLPHM